MADPKDPKDPTISGALTPAEDEKARKAKADKAAADAATAKPEQPSPSQAEADEIKERRATLRQAQEQTRDAKAQSGSATYKTR